MKRKLAAILAVVMTIGSAGIVSADGISVTGYTPKIITKEGWTRIDVGGHSGEKALRIVNAGTGDAYSVTNDYASTGNGHTKVTFWAKDMDDIKEVLDVAGKRYADPEVVAANPNAGANALTVLDTEGEWKKYSVPTSTWAGKVSWYSDWSKTMDGFWIDDIVVYKDATPVHIENFEDRKVWNGWNTTENITGYNYSSIIMAEDGNHIGIISGKSANTSMIYNLGKTYNPSFKMEFKINLPVTVTDNGDGTFTKVPNLAAAHIGPNANVALKDSGFTSRVTAEEITDGSMPDMGEDRAWYSYKWTGKGYWFGDYSKFGIRANSGNVVYIDDIKFIRNDGGSSDTTLHTENFEIYYTRDDFAIQNFSANGSEGKVTLTWRNPASAPTEIKLYDGETDITPATINLASKGINKLDIPVSDTDVHTYKLTATVSGFGYEYTVKGKAGSWFVDSRADKSGTPLQGWYLNKGNEYSYGGVEFDKENVTQGDYALKINPTFLNEAGTDYAAWNGVGMQLEMYTKPLKAEQSYKLSFDYKFLNARGMRVYYNNNYTAVSNTGEMISTGNSVAYGDWTEKEWVFTTTSADNHGLVFSFDGGSDAYWIDNVQLYECDAEGNVTGTVNLVVNGSFENELKNVKIAGGIISWTQNATDDWECVNVYRKSDDGKLTFVGKADTNSYTVGKMKNIQETYVLKTVRTISDLNIFESKSFEITRNADYMVYEPVFDLVEATETEGVYNTLKSGITALEQGLVKASVKLENAKLDTYGVDVYMALYKDSRLQTVTKTTVDATKGETDIASSIIAVPSLDDGVYEMKVFAWKAGEMIPEIEAENLSEPLTE